MHGPCLPADAVRHNPVVVDVWHHTEARRLWLADELASLAPDQWDVASWCDGWSVRHVVAHLVHLAEATTWSVTVQVARAGFVFDRAQLV
jgi:hypothetical protein